MEPFLDHIVILLPHAKLLSLPSWIPQHFTVAPGGRHADNKTENKLICFQDGSYIELISFINDDPALREGHRWGACKPGIIDFALSHSSTSAEENHSAINARLGASGSEVRYQPPVPGGRIRDDGQEIKWKVTGVDEEGRMKLQRGELPFFCHDVSPRPLRVPGGEESVRHPKGIFGMRGLGIYVPEERVGVLIEAWEAVLGLGAGKGEVQGGEEGAFEVGRLNAVRGVKEGVRVTIQAAKGEQLGGMKERGGVLLADLVVGGSSKEKNGVVRIDVPAFDGVGGFYLDLDVPVN